MKKEKKHILWGNYDLNLEEWRDFLAMEDLLKEDEETQYNAIWYENQLYLEDETEDLREIWNEIHMKHGWHFESILVIGSLGLWDGRVTGYKFIKRLGDALDTDNCDFYELYCDGYHLRANGSHHDGNNHYTFLLFSGSESEWDNTDGENKFLEDLYYGRPISKARWHKYTRSIRPFIKEYYGWR